MYVQCPLPWGHSILFWDRLPGKVRQHLPGVHLSRPRTESTAGRGGLGRAALESPGHFWALLERAAVFTHCAGNSELATLVLAHLSSEFPVSLHLLCVRVLVCSSTLPFPKPFSCLCSHSPHLSPPLCTQFNPCSPTDLVGSGLRSEGPLACTRAMQCRSFPGPGRGGGFSVPRFGVSQSGPV